MTLTLNDPKTLQAIHILADVLDDVTGIERLECLMAANALRQVAETRSETALNFAKQTFDSLDADIRRRVEGDATASAEKVAHQGKRKPNARMVRAASVPPATPKAVGVSILDALNGQMKTERRW
jgi:hypothetical protein